MTIDNTYNSYRGGRTGAMFEVVDACLFKVFPELESHYTGGPPLASAPQSDAPPPDLRNAAPIVWICPRCAFDNRAATTFCGNCLSRRPR
jgi:hypothetical protein